MIYQVLNKNLVFIFLTVCNRLKFVYLSGDVKKQKTYQNTWE